MPSTVGPVNPALPIDINVTGLTAHVFVYRLWWRDATSNWTVLGTGSTADNISDHYQLPHSPGLQVSYWFGIHGKPNSIYAGLLAFGQNGQTVPHGNVPIDDKADSKGNAVEEDWVNLQ
jgi:hypothetical protein